jgi:hypothetical protein
MVKTDKNKVPSFYKIDARIDALLREKAEQSGYSQTRIVEDALENWLTGGLSRELFNASERVKCSSVNSAKVQSAADSVVQNATAHKPRRTPRIV